MEKKIFKLTEINESFTHVPLMQPRIDKAGHDKREFVDTMYKSGQNFLIEAYELGEDAFLRYLGEFGDAQLSTFIAKAYTP